MGDVDYDAEPGRPKQERGDRPPAAPELRGVGGEVPFPPLPRTRAEILAIADSFKDKFPDATAPKLLRKKEPTEEEVRRDAPGRRFLHLATHGYFASPDLRSALGPAVRPAGRVSALAPGLIDPFGGSTPAGWHPELLSGIALAGANPPKHPRAADSDDGILTAMEVGLLDLTGVELTVLSACETGLGESAGGEGLLGLQRAFQAAGARSVVASLWSVDDPATQDLMEQMYEHLWKGKGVPASLASAMQKAQVELLRGERPRGVKLELGDQDQGGRLEPFYWAAFVVSGNCLPAAGAAGRP